MEAEIEVSFMEEFGNDTIEVNRETYHSTEEALEQANKWRALKLGNTVFMQEPGIDLNEED